MKTKSKSNPKIIKRKRNPQENPANRARALSFIKSVALNLDKSADRASKHLSMEELKNIAEVLNDVQDAFGLSGLKLPNYKDEVVTDGPKVIHWGGKKDHYFD
jgi:hypothetical protein